MAKKLDDMKARVKAAGINAGKAARKPKRVSIEEMREMARKADAGEPVEAGIFEAAVPFVPPEKPDEVSPADTPPKVKTGRHPDFHPLKKRLPDGAAFHVTYDAKKREWVGSLTVGKVVAEGRHSALSACVFGLLEEYNRMNGTTVADEDKL